MSECDGHSQVDESPLGAPVSFGAAQVPRRDPLIGHRVTLTPLDAEADAGSLYRISHAPHGDPAIWTYLPYGPYPSEEAFRASLAAQAASTDPLFYSVVLDGRPQGVLSYLAIVAEHGSIELGNIWFGPQLRRTPAATEAIFLLAAYAFDTLGYRRVEWKCNALNAPSRRAAERFGFLYEGTFAQHRVVKGRNRDTAWFAITDVRWPAIGTAFERWLSPTNFDAGGRQRQSLRELQS